MDLKDSGSTDFAASAANSQLINSGPPDISAPPGTPAVNDTADLLLTTIDSVKQQIMFQMSVLFAAANHENAAISPTSNPEQLSARISLMESVAREAIDRIMEEGFSSLVHYLRQVDCNYSMMDTTDKFGAESPEKTEQNDDQEDSSAVLSSPILNSLEKKTNPMQSLIDSVSSRKTGSFGSALQIDALVFDASKKEIETKKRRPIQNMHLGSSNGEDNKKKRKKRKRIVLN